MQQGRSHFNPCLLKGVVYLCGVGSTAMEAFAPDTFLPLNITLPDKYSTSCCLYVDNHLLVVNSLNYILKYAVGPGGQLVKKSRVNTPGVFKFQNSQPVVDRGVYFMVWDGKCLGINMQTGVLALSIA